MATYLTATERRLSYGITQH